MASILVERKVLEAVVLGLSRPRQFVDNEKLIRMLKKEMAEGDLRMKRMKRITCDQCLQGGMMVTGTNVCVSCTFANDKLKEGV
jgi:hypothetical protein